MSDHAAVGWFFLSLAVVPACLSLDSRARKRLGWGRTGAGVPLSGFGAAARVGSLWLVAGAAFELLPPAGVCLVVPFLALAGTWPGREKNDAAAPPVAGRRPPKKARP